MSSNETKTIVTEGCVICGERTYLTLNRDSYTQWTNGVYAQDAFPNMTADERELLISGTHPLCFDELFGTEEP